MVITYRRTVEEVLEDDGDLALLNLSVLKPKPHLYDLPLSQEIICYHEKMEIIFESYIMDYNSLHSKLEYLKSQMQSAEELVMLRLDTSRNQLLIADTVISVVAMCLAMGSFVGSVYGMNLKKSHGRRSAYVQRSINAYYLRNINLRKLNHRVFQAFGCAAK